MVRQLERRGPDDEGLAFFDAERHRAAALKTSRTDARAAVGPPSGLDDVTVASQATSDRFRFGHRVGLGHRRFSIIDPSPAGHQPFWSHDGSICVTFNGEIYNYLELRQDLERVGHSFRTRSDTEVLIESFLEWGESCFERFIGFWAVALYDRRKEAVLLARDRMGKAPLYLARAGGTLYWASEILSLRAGLPPEALDVRAQAVSDFVAHGLRDVHDVTFFEGVESFPRAAFGWVGEDGSISPRTYWHIPERRRTEKDVTPDQAAAELRSLLGDAVRLRLRADVPVGVELSGGLDSSSIVATAADDGYSVRAFTVSFPGTEWDEAHFARAVAGRWSHRVEHNLIRPSAGDFFEEADDFVRHMQEPFHSPHLFDHHLIWREMASQGLRVATTGSAGDELFCGYPGHYLIPYLSHLLERGSLARLHREATLFVEEPTGIASRAYCSRLAKAGFHSMKRRSRVIDGFGAQRRDLSLAAELLGGEPSPMHPRSAALEQLLLEKATDWLMNYWLRSTHQNTMGVPIEARNPFLDHRVVELAFSLPTTYLVRDGWFKWIVRHAMKDLLPPEVVFRRNKLGFPFPIRSWLIANKETFFAVASDPSTPCPHVDLRRLRSAYDRMVDVHPMMLWRAMSVSLWWKRCVLDEQIGSGREISRPARRSVA